MSIELFDPAGNRKYLTPNERASFETVAQRIGGDTGSFCLMLLYTGCRISEALQLRCRHIDDAEQVVTFETLKQRKRGIYRQFPLPQPYLDMLNNVHRIRNRQTGKVKEVPLWVTDWKGKQKPWSRRTAYSRILSVMQAAELEGVHATPKGLRHGFAIACLDKAIPLNIVQKWLGHANITTTAIYSNASGAEERSIAERLWS